MISCTEHFCESADFVRLFDQLEGFAEWVEKKKSFIVIVTYVTR